MLPNKEKGINISMVPITKMITINIRPTKPNQPTLLLYNLRLYKLATHSDTYLSITTTTHNNAKFNPRICKLR